MRIPSHTCMYILTYVCNTLSHTCIHTFTHVCAHPSHTCKHNPYIHVCTTHSPTVQAHILTHLHICTYLQSHIHSCNTPVRICMDTPLHAWRYTYTCILHMHAYTLEHTCTHPHTYTLARQVTSECIHGLQQCQSFWYYCYVIFRGIASRTNVALLRVQLPVGHLTISSG